MTTARPAWEPLDQPDDVSTRRLFDYWLERRGQRPLPLRADVDPLDLLRHLPSMFMLDVIDGGRDFRYRLIGTGVVEASGRDPTGALFSTLYADQPDVFGQVQRLFAPAIRECRPVFARGQVFWLQERDHVRFEGGYLPISSTGTIPDILMCQVRFF